MKYLTLLITSVSLFFSCGEIYQDSHDIAALNINISSGKSEEEIKNFLKNLKTHITPNKKLLGPNKIEIPYYYYNESSNEYIENNIYMPLRVNIKGYENPTPSVEEFKFILIHKGAEVFNESLQVFYNNQKPPAVITKMNIKNEKKEWVTYKPQKIEFKKGEKGTGIFFEIVTY